MNYLKVPCFKPVLYSLCFFVPAMVAVFFYQAKGMCVRASLVFVVCDKGLHLTVMGDGKTPVFQIDGFGMRSNIFCSGP